MFANERVSCVRAAHPTAGAEWHSFVRQLGILERERKGAARLVSAIPGEFDIEVKAVDSRGHLGVSGALSRRRVGDAEWCVQRLHFASCKPPLMSNVKPK